MFSSRIAASWLIFVAACGASSPPAARAPAPQSGRRVAKDTEVTVAPGATLVAPGGWWLGEEPGAVTLADPDRALTVHVSQRDGPDALAAIAAAWKRARPDFAL